MFWALISTGPKQIDGPNPPQLTVFRGNQWAGPTQLRARSFQPSTSAFRVHPGVAVWPHVRVTRIPALQMDFREKTPGQIRNVFSAGFRDGQVVGWSEETGMFPEVRARFLASTTRAVRACIAYLPRRPRKSFLSRRHRSAVKQ